MRQMLWEGDTKFGHYQVIDTLYDGRAARVFYSGDRQSAQSGVPKDDSPDLLFDYNQRLFELVTNLVPTTLLLIGGGVFTLPTALLGSLPHIRIDIVEPDSDLTGIAQEYFDLPMSDRLRIFNTDGRTFLREHASRYDMVIVDAFVQMTTPKDLRTLQAFGAYHKHMNAQGVFAMNVISGYHGRNAVILEQLSASACQTFDSVDIFLAGLGYSLWLPQNFILTTQKGQSLPLKDYVRYNAVEPLKASHDMILKDEEN